MSILTYFLVVMLEVRSVDDTVSKQLYPVKELFESEKQCDKYMETPAKLSLTLSELAKDYEDTPYRIAGVRCISTVDLYSFYGYNTYNI